MDRPSALSGTFQPHRPSGSGWVEYHDVQPMTGAAGLAMTWRAPDGRVRFVAVVDRQRDGRVCFSGTVGDLQDVGACVGEAIRASAKGPTEAASLRLLLPHVSATSPAQAGPGLPPLGEHAAVARRAVAEARLPNAMRGALTACLDMGSPYPASLTSLRARVHSPLWPALALAMTDTGLYDIAVAADTEPLAAADPLAAIRGRWPGLSPAHVNRMRRPGAFPRPWRGTGRTTPSVCLDLLGACPVDWWPRGTDGWAGFIACAQALKVIRDACPGAGSLRDLAAPSKGDWDAFATRLCDAAGIEVGSVRQGASHLTTMAMACRDPVRSLATTATLPLLAAGLDDEGMALLEDSLGQERQGEVGTSPLPQAAFDLAGRLLYGDKSAAAVLEASREWHARRQAIDSRTRETRAALTWPALFEGTFRHGDLGVMAVASHDALRAEGWRGEDGDGVRGLDHCVATRLSECLSGRAHILSVRSVATDGGWERLSTCEVKLRVDAYGQPRIDVVEHKGQGNAEPEDDAVKAVSALAQAVTAGRVAVSEGALSPRRHKRSLEDVCGYDWRDAGAVANAFEAWRPLLPRWVRDLGPDDLRDALTERGMLPDPDPATAPVPGTP